MRPRRPRVLNRNQIQHILAMVCVLPPEGRARWTIQLITEQAVRRKLAPKVGRETIRSLLQKHDLKTWRGKDGRIAEWAEGPAEQDATRGRPSKKPAAATARSG